MDTFKQYEKKSWNTLVYIRQVIWKQCDMKNWRTQNENWTKSGWKSLKSLKWLIFVGKCQLGPIDTIRVVFFFWGGGGGSGGWGERRRNFRQNILLSLGIAARFCFWYVANLGELIDFYSPGIIRKHGFVMIWGGIEVN